MKRLILIFWFLGIQVVYGQQEAQFSQYIFNTLHINPAYAGYKGETYFQSCYRTQWTGVEGAPKTLSFSIDGNINDKLGISLIVNNDKIGAQSDLIAYAGLAYHLPLGYYKNAKLSFGLSAGVIQSKLDGNQLIADEDADTSIPTGNLSSAFPDARFGMLFTTSKFYIGLSANNLMASWSAFKKNNQIKNIVPQMHLYLTGGLLFDLNDDLKLKPTFLIKDDTKGPTNLDLNAFLLISEKIWIGAVYRTAIRIYDKPQLQDDLLKSSATGLMTEFFISRQLRVGYSFDYALNKLKDYNNGTHEISIGFYLRKKRLSQYDYLVGCYF